MIRKRKLSGPDALLTEEEWDDLDQATARVRAARQAFENRDGDDGSGRERTQAVQNLDDLRRELRQRALGRLLPPILRSAKGQWEMKI